MSWSKRLRHFPRREFEVGRRHRNAHARDDLARAQIRLAIALEEILERDFPFAVRSRQHQACAQRDQRRRPVADRRGVGDVAADRRGIPDLHRRETQQQLAQRRIERHKVGHAGGPADAGADLQVRRTAADAFEFGDLAEIDDAGERAMLLGHPQAEIGAAGEQRRIGIALHHLHQLDQAVRREERLAAGDIGKAARPRERRQGARQRRARPRRTDRSRPRDTWRRPHP